MIELDMTKQEIIEFLRENLTLSIEFRHSYTYYEDSEIVVNLLLDNDVVSRASASVPTYVVAESSY